jgi:hypothetical protein
LAATGIRVHLCNFMKHFVFCCVLAANLVFNDIDFFRNPVTLLKQILNWNLLYGVITIFIIIISSSSSITIIIIAIIRVHSK